MTHASYSILQIAENIRYWSLKFCSGVQSAHDRIDHKTFGQLEEAAKELAKALKGEDLISRSLLYELYGCIQILRNDAPRYSADDQVILNQMADKLEHTFTLILMGESHEDRVPGIPQII